MKAKLGPLLASLLLAGCVNDPVVDASSTQVSIESTTSTTPEVTMQTSLPEATTLTDAETLVEAFVKFARDPSDGTFGELSLAETVDLGLGPTIIKTIEGTELREPEVWRLDLDNFRAHTGPFSAFDSMTRLDTYETTVGEHSHCASPPVPPAEGYEGLGRISVQPRLGPQDSCLMWSTVDFFLLPNGDVAAITLDMWEP
jgi:hypothetical protein